jgi:hypothetical protein
VIREVTYYVVACDRCGKDADYGDYTAWSDETGARESCCWEVLNGRDLCDDCWTWNEDESEIVEKPAEVAA